MNTINFSRRAGRSALDALATVCAASAPAVLLSTYPIVRAVTRGDRTTAARLINIDARFSYSQIDFLAGRMLDEDICVLEDHAIAAHYFEHGAKLGDHAAALDFAPKVGLGEGATENAWHLAVTSAPQPDAARFDNQMVELSLDANNTLEAGRSAAQSGMQETLRPLLPVDVHPMTAP